MNQHDIKQELVNYTREADLRNVPMWLKDAIKSWVEAVELNQDEFSFYDENKAKIANRTDYLSLDNLLELDESYDKFRDWFNRQKARFDRAHRA
jgi:hypothetical protein